MKIYILSLITAISFCSTYYAQVGIATANPQGIFNIDGARDNPTTGTPNAVQQTNDFVVTSSGSTGIGTTTPDASAILDLTSTNKGILIPRINLISNTVQIGTAVNAVGLMVYNTGTALPKGFYFWNGTEWRGIDNSTVVNPSVIDINCGSAVLSPSSYTSGTPYSGNLTVSYSGGNGGTYTAGSSITVNGLTFTLRPGKLNYGSGDLVFSVSGNPTASSPSATNITINSSLVPFLTSTQNCTARVGDQSNADISSLASIGPLFLNPGEILGGSRVYHRYVTSPDGKFSVRVKVEQGNAVALSDIQIRSNSGTPNIMWNFMTDYVTNGHYVQGNNGTTFPAQGVWYGNGGGNGTTFGSGSGQAWGDPDVYYGSPEFRRYTWTSTDPSDKTMYILTFMLGAPNDNLVANTTNCPGGTCTLTKAFLKIEQINAP